MFRTALPTDRPGWLGLAVRVSVVLAAAIAVCLDLPVAVTTVMTGVAVAVVSSELVAGRRRDQADAVLTATGGTLVVLMLTGLGLALAGFPLNPRTWAVSLAAISVAGLIWRHPGAGDQTVDRVARRGEPRAAIVLTAWLVVAGLIGVAALVISVRVTAAASQAPLEMSLARAGTGAAAVAIRTARATGPMELRVTGASGRSHGYRVPSLAAGVSTQIGVRVPVSGLTLITLSAPGHSQPLRTLIVGSRPNTGLSGG